MVAPARITDFAGQRTGGWVVGVNRKHVENRRFCGAEAGSARRPIRTVRKTLKASVQIVGGVMPMVQNSGSSSGHGLVKCSSVCPWIPRVWSHVVRQDVTADSAPKRAAFGLRRAAHGRRHPCKSRRHEVISTRCASVGVTCPINWFQEEHRQCKLILRAGWQAHGRIIRKVRGSCRAPCGRLHYDQRRHTVAKAAHPSRPLAGMAFPRPQCVILKLPSTRRLALRWCLCHQQSPTTGQRNGHRLQLTNGEGNRLSSMYVPLLRLPKSVMVVTNTSPRGLGVKSLSCRFS